MTQLADTVYPVLRAGVELRYSVRSLLRHGSNVGRLFFIGDKPSFFDLTKAAHVPFKDVRGKAYENVWRKLWTIAHDERVSERFAFLNDDFYILRPFDARAIPNYCRGEDLKNVKPTSPYKKVLARTYEALKKRGMTTFHFGTHQPVNFEKEKVIATCKEFQDEIASGLSFRCCYHNMHRSQRTIKTTTVLKVIGQRPPNKWAFASRGNANLITLEKSLKRIYPERSNLEL